MTDLPYVIGEKPVRHDPQGWLILHDAYEGWVPAEPPLFSGHVRALVWAAIVAGVVVIGAGL
jgi:hypothetical protein